MPDPLAMPFTVMVWPSISVVLLAPLAKVSVVRMARAASCQLAVPKSAVIWPAYSATACPSRGSPITPVEAMRI